MAMFKPTLYPEEVYQMLNSVIQGQSSEDKVLSSFCIKLLQKWDSTRGTK